MYAFLDQEDTDLAIEAIRRHLDECGPCLRQFQVEAALKALVRRSCSCEPAPAQLRVRIMRQIKVQIRLQG
jgi:mycothiol system anti-sigma-R factor